MPLTCTCLQAWGCTSPRRPCWLVSASCHLGTSANIQVTRHSQWQSSKVGLWKTVLDRMPRNIATTAISNFVIPSNIHPCLYCTTNTNFGIDSDVFESQHHYEKKLDVDFKPLFGHSLIKYAIDVFTVTILIMDRTP